MAKTQTRPTTEPTTPTDHVDTLARQTATIETLKAQIAALTAAKDDAANANPFLALFPVPSVIFKNRVQLVGKPWDDGTTSQRVCDVTVQVGDREGCWIPNCNIVLKTFTNGAQRFELQMPSSSRAGGKMHVPFLDVPKGTNADRDYSEWMTAVVDRWMTERRAAVAAGAPSIATQTRNAGILVQSDELLTALGIVKNDPKLAPKAEPVAAPATT